MRSPQALKIRLILRDNKNRLFDNFTSLDVSWSSSNFDMASFDVSNSGVQMEYQEDIFSQQHVKSICKWRVQNSHCGLTSRLCLIAVYILCHLFSLSSV